MAPCGAGFLGVRSLPWLNFASLRRREALGLAPIEGFPVL